MSEIENLHLGAHEGGYDNPDDAVYGAETTPEGKISKGLELWASIGIGIGKSLDDFREELRRTRINLQKNTPVNYMGIAAGVYPASGNLILNLGSPDAGTFWEVRHITIGGNDVNVVAAGTAGVYVSGTTVQSGGILSNRDYTGYLPNVAYYGTHQFVVANQEWLLVVIFGGTPGQQYAANAHLEIFPDATAQGQTKAVE